MNLAFSESIESQIPLTARNQSLIFLIQEIEIQMYDFETFFSKWVRNTEYMGGKLLQVKIQIDDN